MSSQSKTIYHDRLNEAWDGTFKSREAMLENSEELDLSNGKNDLAGKIQTRLDLYRQAKAYLDPNLKTVHFDKVQSGRFIRFKAVSPVNPEHPWASLAEFEILTE